MKYLDTQNGASPRWTGSALKQAQRQTPQEEEGAEVEDDPSDEDDKNVHLLENQIWVFECGGLGWFALLAYICINCLIKARILYLSGP